MSSLNKLIKSEIDANLREELEERLAIVEHKIKFMDKVPVCVLDTLAHPGLTLMDYAENAGAGLTTNAGEAAFLIFYEEGKNLEELMRLVPTLLDENWSAVKYNRVYLLADTYQKTNPADAIALTEDIAEMIHPGHFIFGFEGDKWIKFTL